MAEVEPIALSEAFQEILDRLENTKDNLFITGPAGTGKSTLLRIFAKTTAKKVVITAPTGIAALQAGGQTIHSFFLFPPYLFGPGEVKRGRFKKLYLKIDVLVIDEISMVRADILDRIDRFLQLNRSNTLPFGGVQVVFFGDLYQLPPVVRREDAEVLYQWGYESPFFFSAKILQPPFKYQIVELNEVYRQKDRKFLSLLHDIRMNRADQDCLDLLNERVKPLKVLEAFQLVLAARNAKVDAINRHKLEQLPTKDLVYQAEVSGTFNANSYPTDQLLRLRVGAQVMFIRNDPEGAFVNGTLGQVVSADEKQLTVSILDESNEKKDIVVEQSSWEIFRYALPEKADQPLKREVLGTFKQYPIRLAWAVTIHKSQGQTFDQVVLDLSGGMFEHGQLYVALSRCRSLEGITLSEAIKPRDVMVDERIVDFYQSF